MYLLKYYNNNIILKLIENTAEKIGVKPFVLELVLTHTGDGDDVFVDIHFSPYILNSNTLIKLRDDNIFGDLTESFDEKYNKVGFLIGDYDSYLKINSFEKSDVKCFINGRLPIKYRKRFTNLDGLRKRLDYLISNTSDDAKRDALNIIWTKLLFSNNIDREDFKFFYKCCLDKGYEILLGEILSIENYMNGEVRKLRNSIKEYIVEDVNHPH